MKGRTTLVLIAVLAAYVIVGAVIFSHLESSNEQRNRDSFYASLSTFQANYACINDTDVAILQSIFDTMLVGGTSLSTSSDGSTSLVNGSRWDYSTAIFTAVQLGATLGYYIPSPKSTGGRIFTVFFALIAIPLFVLSAIGFGQLLHYVVDLLLRRIAICRYGPRNENLDVSTWMNLVYGPRRRILYRSLVLLVIGSGLFVLIPGVIFSTIEGWSYRDSLYYIFTTINTLGVRDLIPGYANTPGWLYNVCYRLAVAVWLVIVIGWYLGTIAVVQIFELKLVKRIEDRIAEPANIKEHETVQYSVNQIGSTSVVNVTKRDEKVRPKFWLRSGKSGRPKQNTATRGNNVAIESTGGLSPTSVVKIGS